MVHIQIKFDNDIASTSCVIMKTAVILFLKIYRRLTLMSQCDVIAVVINVRDTSSWITLCGLPKSDVKLKLC